MKNKENIAIVWLKRDLRLHDNEALHKAINSNKRVLILYVFENLLLNDPHYSERHWNFIKQYLSDINNDLSKYNTKVLSVTGEIFAVFNQLQTKYNITEVFSHQETGLLVTFNRDKEFARYCRNNSIEWTETVNNGVLRGLLNRDDWFEKWEDYMYQPQIEFNGTAESFISLSEIHTLSEYFRTTNLKTEENTNFQYGGTKMAWKYANSFFAYFYRNE